MRLYIFIALVFFISIEAYSQMNYKPNPFTGNDPITGSLYDDNNAGKSKEKFFGFTSHSGELYVNGIYRNQTTSRDDIFDKQHTYKISGGLKLKAGCYFWNPNFMQLDVAAEYSPETHQEKYIIIPNSGEVNTLKNLDIRALFLNKKIITFGGNVTFNENYSNRENLSDIRTRSKNYGGFINFNSKYVPMSVSYSDESWIQREIMTGRIMNVKQKELKSSLQTSFSKYDKHYLTFSHAYFQRSDNDIYNNKSRTNQLILNDEIRFDHKGDYRLNLITSAFDRKIYSDYTRINTFENFTAKLPLNFNLIASYSFFHILQESQKINQHTINGLFGHKLFNSLNTDIFGSYINTNHSQYKSADTKYGFDIRYTKKIPLKGSLCLAYKYSMNHRTHESSSTTLQVFNEEYSLTDGSLTLLLKPYIDATTIQVTDVTGTIIYQPNFDYLLSNQGNYQQISRIPGGQIANNATVYVSYTYTQPGDYKYDANNNLFSANLAFFKNLVEFYYSFSNQDYIKLRQTEFLQLNTYEQSIYGIKLNYKFVSAGAEYITYNSNIVPYKSLGYFVQLQGTFLKHFDGTLNANMHNITLTDQNIKENSANASAVLGYSIKAKTRISIQSSYMHQDYQNSKLNLIMFGADISTSIRKIFITAGWQYYKRYYLNEKINYNGGYIQIARRF